MNLEEKMLAAHAIIMEKLRSGDIKGITNMMRPEKREKMNEVLTKFMELKPDESK